MLRTDSNRYISTIYRKSLELHRYKESQYYDQGENVEPVEGENEDDKWDRLDYKCRNEAKQYCKSIYNNIKLQKASDVYHFEENVNPIQHLLTHQEKYIPYPRKDNLKEAIAHAMVYQETANLIDYHPNVNDLSGDIKQLVDEQMKKQGHNRWNYREPKEKPEQNTHDIVKIRNIIHQSLQPYNELYCSTDIAEEIKKYFKRLQSQNGLDQWGKERRLSPSQFLWLPVKFTYSEENQMYEVDGKLFNPLEQYPELPTLKKELGHLMTHFSGPLKQVHEHFKNIHYKLMHNYSDFDDGTNIHDVKSQVDFSQDIHAIVKISEMEIQPHSTYSGQWHVEGFTSDNILYTCLYVIEHDENLVNGRLQFKRTPHSDDVPGDPYEQEQCAHTYCPDYEYLCDPHKVIPLGSVDIKENLMLIFPNQNIHKVKGISNQTDKPLKRKIIAFFVVNNVDQPITINDVEFNQPIEVIKQNRLKDMYERSKNKQTEAQSFNYCEH